MRKQNRAARRQPFRERVRELREQAGLGQNDLAAKANMARAVMSRLMNGAREFRTEHVLPLARIFRMTAAELVEGTEAEDILGNWVPRAQYEESERSCIEANKGLASAREELKALSAKIDEFRITVDRQARHIQDLEGDAVNSEAHLGAATNRRKALPEYRPHSPAPSRAVPLHSNLTAIASSFVTSVLDAVRGSSLEELLGESGGARRRPRRPRSATSNGFGGATSPGASGRLKRRSSEDIAKSLDAILALVRASKAGLRAEQIRKSLGMQPKEMPRLLREGLSTGKLSSRGQKRSTTYFAE